MHDPETYRSVAHIFLHTMTPDLVHIQLLIMVATCDAIYRPFRFSLGNGTHIRLQYLTHWGMFLTNGSPEGDHLNLELRSSSVLRLRASSSSSSGSCTRVSSGTALILSPSSLVCKKNVSRPISYPAFKAPAKTNAIQKRPLSAREPVSNGPEL